MTPAMGAAIDALVSTPAGGFASVLGYRPKTGYTVTPLVDYSIISRFHTGNYYSRREEAVAAITVEDVLPGFDPIEHDAVRACFADRKAKLAGEITSERAASAAAAHVRNYKTFAPGVKVNFETVKNDDGLQVPVLADNGLPTATSLLLSGLQMSAKYREQGERKIVKSGVPVRVSKALTDLIPKHLNSYRTFALNPENHEAVKIGGKVIDPQWGELLEG